MPDYNNSCKCCMIPSIILGLLLMRVPPQPPPYSPFCSDTQPTHSFLKAHQGLNIGLNCGNIMHCENRHGFPLSLSKNGFCLEERKAGGWAKGRRKSLGLLPVFSKQNKNKGGRKQRLQKHLISIFKFSRKKCLSTIEVHCEGTPLFCGILFLFVLN